MSALTNNRSTLGASVERTESEARTPRSGNWETKIVVLVLLGVFCTEILATMRVNAPTVDEVTFVASGYYMLRTGDLSLNAGNPILLEALLALPIIPMHFALPQHPTPFFQPGKFAFIDNWRYAVAFYDLNHRMVDRITFRTRLVTLAFSLVLGLFIFLWGSELYGRNGGLFSLFIYVFDPNILAFSGLGSLDIGGACFTFIALYSYTKLIQKPSVGRLVAAGVTLALAMVSKPPAIFLVPIFVLALLPLIKTHTESWTFLARRLGQAWRKPASFAVSLGGALLVAWFVVNLIYGFHGTLQPLRNYVPRLSIPTAVIGADGRPISPPQPHSALARFLKPKLAALPILFPASLMESIRFMSSAGQLHTFSFLMGRYSASGWWYYHLVASFLKLPIPLLLLLIALAILLCWRGAQGELLPDEWILVIATATYFGLISLLGHAVGFRHVIPALTFSYVLLGKLTTIDLRRNKIAFAGFLALCAWYPIESLRVAPHYLAYFNELIGGPDNGYKYMVDSNLDWGQDLKGLKQYMDQHQIRRIKLSYFGSANPAWYGIEYDYLPSIGLRPSTPDGKWWYEPSSQEDCKPTDGIIAVSATNLHAQLFRNHQCYDWLRQYHPVATIGHSIFVYRIPAATK
jgi:Dolichyl-phosphate-mannose-protein mannosyltransferase